MYGDFYIMSEDYRTIPKNLNNKITTENLIIKSDCDIHNPTLELEYNINIIKSNYVFISEFNKFYFITDKVVSPAGKLIITCHIDVLQTYYTYILGSKQLISRQEQQYSKYQSDNLLPLSVEKNLYLIPFSDNELNISKATQNNMNFVITVSGADVIDPTITEV